MTDTINVEVPEELAEAVRQAVEDGAYSSPSELMRQLLEDWVKRTKADAIAELRRLWDEGIASGGSHDVDEVFAEVWKQIDRA